MSSAQLYHRRAFFVASPCYEDNIHATPLRSTIHEPQRDALTWADKCIIAAFALCITPATLGVLTCIMSELPLKLYFQQETPYSALTHSAHVQIIMWGSLVTLILISLLWFHAERMFSKSWIVAVRWLLLAALTTSPMPVGIAFVRSVSALRTVAPDGFYFEHGLRLGLWGLVPEAVLLFILGAILKHFRCLPPIL